MPNIMVIFPFNPIKLKVYYKNASSSLFCHFIFSSSVISELIKGIGCKVENKSHF